MKKEVNIHTVILGFALLLVAAGVLLAAAGTALAGSLPPEPGEEYLINEDVNTVVGFYYREYSLGRDGIVDYKTARQILSAEYSEEWNTIVETKEFPLFYWYDADHDGQFGMWIDRRVEGCPCDIVRY